MGGEKNQGNNQEIFRKNYNGQCIEIMMSIVQVMTMMDSIRKHLRKPITHITLALALLDLT